MSEPISIPTEQVTVRIEARDLTTEVSSREFLQVPAPQSEDAQEEQLTALVVERYPESKKRTFADGAATFLQRGLLVIAAYEDLPAPEVRVKKAKTSTSAGSDQDSLFST